jgi:hypothetical protein
MSDWLKSRALKKGQRVRATKLEHGKPFDQRETVEGTVIEDTDGFFEVFSIDVDGVQTKVFYPTEILS